MVSKLDVKDRVEIPVKEAETRVAKLLVLRQVKTGGLELTLQRMPALSAKSRHSGHSITMR